MGKINNECIGRTVAYAVYNIGGTILIGLVRTIVAIAYLAKHVFYSAKIHAAKKVLTQEIKHEHAENASKRKQKNLQADKKAQNSPTNVVMGMGQKVASGVTQVKNKIAQGIDDLGTDMAESAVELGAEAAIKMEKEKSKKWKEVAKRGIGELFLVGGWYYAYQDNFGDKKVSVFGLEELVKLIKKEEESDKVYQSVLGKELYNPIF